MIVNSVKNYSYIPQSQSIAFDAIKSRKEAAKFKEQNGIDATTKPNYDGYTGSKDYNFPISPFLNKNQYPDVTENFKKLRDEIFEELDKLNGGHKDISKANATKSLLTPRVLKFMMDNCQTGEPLDTKFNPDFPGRNKDGNTQYALYKGKIVSANYLSNNIYGQMTARLGIPFELSKFIGSTAYSSGVFELRYGRLPSRDVMKYRDPQEDIDSIRSGYNDYLHNDPWKDAEEYGLDPKRPYPKEEVEEKEPFTITA